MQKEIRPITHKNSIKGLLNNFKHKERVVPKEQDEFTV